MCRSIFISFIALFYLGQCTNARSVQGNDLDEMPPGCEGKSYCTTQSADYPEDIIEKLLMSVDGMWEVVLNKTMPEQRQGWEGDECNANPIYDPIYEIMDENDRMRFVVQSTKRFSQVVWMTECKEPGALTKATRQLRNELETHDFECKQTYLNYKFLVLSLDMKKLEAVRMKEGVPVCCKCVHLGKKVA